jgi:hypothetical protein
VRSFTIALVVLVALAVVMLLLATAQNEGCFPWQTPVSTGGGVFSENDRGETFCR